MLIPRLTLTNLLSFRNSTVELGQLNVLIGPNAVGKSNLIEAVGLLQSCQSGIAGAILRGGGVRQWVSLAGRDHYPVAGLDCEVLLTHGRHLGPILYELQFTEDSGTFSIHREVIRKCIPDQEKDLVYVYRSGGRAEFGPEALRLSPGLPSPLHLQPFDSLLSQFRSLGDPTPVSDLGNHLSRIRIYREFRTGYQSGARLGASANSPNDILADGSDNLALVLNKLDVLGVHDRIKDYLKRFCERFVDVRVRVGEGQASAFLREEGLKEMLSAIRMSDGTLKFLSLLAALFNPTPPPLMCIEEPETGLHPDALQLVAEALLEASESMQLIVTTHSEALVDALTDRPENVLVCERDFDGGTQMKRLSRDRLKEWLQDYTLGHLWRKGEIGGGRW